MLDPRSEQIDRIWRLGRRPHQGPSPRPLPRFDRQRRVIRIDRIPHTTVIQTPHPRMTRLTFLLQLHIRVITQNNNPQEVWRVSALLPFAALATVTELSRSARYHMEELEMSARFSLKTLLMARLTLLGLGNLVLLAVLLPLVTGWSQLPLTQTGCMLLCPYCLTSLICLVLSRRFRGSEVVFVCAGVAATVSWGCFWWRESPRILLESTNVAGWAGITLILLALMLWEGRRYVCDREEWIWN